MNIERRTDCPAYSDPTGAAASSLSQIDRVHRSGRLRETMGSEPSYRVSAIENLHREPILCSFGRIRNQSRERHFSPAKRSLDFHIIQSSTTRCSDQKDVAAQAPALNDAFHRFGRSRVLVRQHHGLEWQGGNIEAQCMLLPRVSAGEVNLTGRERPAFRLHFSR